MALHEHAERIGIAALGPRDELGILEGFAQHSSMVVATREKVTAKRH
jgi:hypothetical protein